MMALAAFWLGVDLLAVAPGPDGSAGGPRRKDEVQGWAASYWTGPGTSGLVSFDLGRDGRFCYRRGSDIGTLEEACGDTTSRADGSFLFTVSQGKAEALLEPWYGVAWGERRYLVPASQMIEFLNSVNWAFEPRTEEAGQFLFRRGDSRLKVEALPPVSPAFAGFLLRTPVRGRVVRVSGADEGEIDIGTRQGLRRGMGLWVRGAEAKWFGVEVEEVSELSSMVRVQLAGDGPLMEGQEVSSRP